MMEVVNPYERYKQQDVLMANPLELVVMLYDGCIKQLKLARMSIREKRFEKTNACFQKAQNILLELINSLDFHYSTSNELLSIYEYLLNQIVEINTAKDETRIESLIGLLVNLREAWATIQKNYKGNLQLSEEQ